MGCLSTFFFILQGEEEEKENPKLTDFLAQTWIVWLYQFYGFN